MCRGVVRLYRSKNVEDNRGVLGTMWCVCVCV